MRVLLLKFPLHSAFGGGEIHTMQLVERLSERGIKFYFLTSCKVLLKEFKKQGWHVRRIWGGSEPVSFKQVLKFALFSPIALLWTLLYLLYYRIFHRVKVVYCHTLTEKLLATLPARLLGMKVVWIEHLRIERWLKSNPYLIFYKILSRLAKVVAVSKSVGSQLEDLGVPNSSLKVIYNGIDTHMFSPKAKNNDLDKIVIGLACRLAKEKGIDTLIRVFARLQKKFRNLKLRISGSGPEKKRLEVLAARLGLASDVEFLGQVKPAYTPVFFNSLDIATLLSRRRESFGLMAAEAQACRKPVVATNISGLAEVVKNGETGIVVPIDDRKKITRAFSKLIKSKELRLTMGKAGRKRVKKYFSLDKMIDDFYNLFTKI